LIQERKFLTDLRRVQKEFALGIQRNTITQKNRVKHILGLVEGATENAAAAQARWINVWRPNVARTALDRPSLHQE
jgi:hypothetical protein